MLDLTIYKTRADQNGLVDEKDIAGVNERTIGEAIGGAVIIGLILLSFGWKPAVIGSFAHFLFARPS